MTTPGLPSFPPLNPDGTPAATPQPTRPQQPQATPPMWRPAPTPATAAPTSPAPVQQPTTQYMQRPPVQQPTQFMQRPVSPAPMHTQPPAQQAPATHYGSPAPTQDGPTRGTTSSLDITLLSLAVILPCVCMLTLYGSPFVMFVLTICSGLRIKHFQDQNQRAPFVTWTAMWWALVMIPLTLTGAILMQDWSLNQISQS